MYVWNDKINNKRMKVMKVTKPISKKMHDNSHLEEDLAVNLSMCNIPKKYK